MKYGTIFSMDYDEKLRLMAIGFAYSGRTTNRDVWNAVTLYDPQNVDPEAPEGWNPGDIVTFVPGEAGIIVIEEPTQ